MIFLIRRFRETVSYYLDNKKRQPVLEELKIKNSAEVKVVIQSEGGIILVDR